MNTLCGQELILMTTPFVVAKCEQAKHAKLYDNNNSSQSVYKYVNKRGAMTPHKGMKIHSEATNS